MNKIIILFLLISSFFQAQNMEYYVLEKEIYHNNQLGKHNLSQKKLLSILENNNLTQKETVFVNFLLANTFRSLNDFPTTVKYLDKAMALSYNLPKEEDSLRMSIKAEMAFNYFDNNRYKESDSIMQEFVKLKFRNTNLIDKAYIIMQMAYLKYLEKDFDASEKMFNESSDILQKASPCNLPVILVKKMQLYAKKNNIDSVTVIYDRSMKIANQCSILKYKIYATQELLEIYKYRGDANKVYEYLNILDALKREDNKEARLSNMHVDNQNILEKENTEEEKSFFWKTILFVVLAIAASLLGFIFYRRSTKYKKEKYEIDAELQEMKKMLQNYAQIKQEITHEDKFIRNENKLTERQKELLNLMSKGLSNKEIAEKLFISENTVKYHIKNIYLILELKDRKEFFIKVVSKNN